MLALLTDNDDEDSKRICFQCVGDDFLSNRMKKDGLIARCSYCQNDDEPTFTIDEMADCVAVAFEQHYDRTSTQPSSMQYAMQADKESDYIWDREGEPVDDMIAMAASIPQDAASDIREVLAERSSDWDSSMFGEETEFDGESYYQSKDIGGGRWQAAWSSFELSLKTEARFFSRSAAQHLTELFDGIDKITARGKKTVLVEAGPGGTISSLYRARSFPRYGEMHDALARPDLHLGPPPAKIARAGRMNAHGISVFYGPTTHSSPWPRFDRPSAVAW
ncbi:hypothetical protein [Rhizobium rhizogenes]|uniref:hypothetical protein n=1 Tax=Rhizobium rhizogenes TaxID=359 RepID=UPI001294BBC4|nr:hypothetical protein [Rhizobium rhizogenes]